MSHDNPTDEVLSWTRPLSLHLLSFNPISNEMMSLPSSGPAQNRATPLLFPLTKGKLGSSFNNWAYCVFTVVYTANTCYSSLKKNSDTTKPTGRIVTKKKKTHLDKTEVLFHMKSKPPSCMYFPLYTFFTPILSLYICWTPTVCQTLCEALSYGI